MEQPTEQQQMLKGIIKLLGDASVLDPANQNFVLWLAQAYVATGDYNDAMFTINKLTTSNPQLVGQFNQQLAEYVKGLQSKQSADAAAAEKAAADAKAAPQKK